jgi:imidazolonepropionase-like amidohydrolase
VNVAQEARRGDGWVKLVGDWIDREVGDLAPSWPRAAVEAAIAEAHRLGARVTAHCFAENSLQDLAEAGIDCVEHATGLTDDLIPLFASRGVAIVPTLVNIATFPKLADGGESKFPRWSAHMRRLHERRYDTVRGAYDAGIPVHVCTEAGGSLPHGLVAAGSRNW